jgi:hypothetical protein
VDFERVGAMFSGILGSGFRMPGLRYALGTAEAGMAGLLKALCGQSDPRDGLRGHDGSV